jgi:hypothetical protein
MTDAESLTHMVLEAATEPDNEDGSLGATFHLPLETFQMMIAIGVAQERRLHGVTCTHADAVFAVRSLFPTSKSSQRERALTSPPLERVALERARAVISDASNGRIVDTDADSANALAMNPVHARAIGLAVYIDRARHYVTAIVRTIDTTEGKRGVEVIFVDSINAEDTHSTSTKSTGRSCMCAFIASLRNAARDMLAVIDALR